MGCPTKPDPSVALLTPTDIRALAEEQGVAPTKRLGQNFLHDAGTVRKIVRLAQVTKGDTVLEVGPGLGSLTLGLLEAGAAVLAVEIDARLGRALPDTAKSHAPSCAEHLTVLHADALTLTGEEPRDQGLPPPTMMVANLPYNVAVPVIFHALEVFPSLTRLLVMVQKEVAQRLVAPIGGKAYGGPTAKLAWYGKARMVGTVGPAVFWPKPNVDSALVLAEISRPGEERKLARPLAFRLVDAAFQDRRKMVRSSLRKVFGSADRTAEILEVAGVEGTMRAEQLGIEQFVSIAEAAEGITS